MFVKAMKRRKAILLLFLFRNTAGHFKPITRLFIWRYFRLEREFVSLFKIQNEYAAFSIWLRSYAFSQLLWHAPEDYIRSNLWRKIFSSIIFSCDQQRIPEAFDATYFRSHLWSVSLWYKPTYISKLGQWVKKKRLEKLNELHINRHHFNYTIS